MRCPGMLTEYTHILKPKRNLILSTHRIVFSQLPPLVEQAGKKATIGI